MTISLSADFLFVAVIVLGGISAIATVVLFACSDNREYGDVKRKRICFKLGFVALFFVILCSVAGFCTYPYVEISSSDYKEVMAMYHRKEFVAEIESMMKDGKVTNKEKDDLWKLSLVNSTRK